MRPSWEEVIRARSLLSIDSNDLLKARAETNFECFFGSGAGEERVEELWRMMWAFPSIVPAATHNVDEESWTCSRMMGGEGREQERAESIAEAGPAGLDARPQLVNFISLSAPPVTSKEGVRVQQSGFEELWIWGSSISIGEGESEGVTPSVYASK